jgi:polyhydroxybutyrate depolymerase
MSRHDHHRTRFALVVLATVSLLLAACSDGGGTDAADDQGGSTSTSTTAATPEAAAEVRSSAGCGTPPAVTATDEDPGDVALTFPSGGKERTYRLGIPADYDPDSPAPLVMNLHGAAGTALGQSTSTDMPRKAGARGFITVAPEAVNGVWEMAGTGADDDFLEALLDDVIGHYCVDPDRVHVVGMSLGAWKTALTACQHPDRIASIALVTVELHPGCTMPVVAFHGTADNIVPYGEGAEAGVVVTNGNGGMQGTRLNIASWAKAAGCSEDKEIETIGDDIERWVYEGCSDHLGVELYTMFDAGHVWPGGRVRSGTPTTDTIDATEIALDWFEAHPKRH